MTYVDRLGYRCVPHGLLLFLLMLAGLGLTAQSSVVLSEPLAVAAADAGAVGPRLAVLPDGSALVLWGRAFPGADSLYLARQQPDGSFSEPLTLPTHGAAPFINALEGPQIASSGNTVYVAFGSTANAHGHVLRSDDGGSSWTGPFTATPSGTQLSLIAVGAAADGSAQVAYLDLAGVPAYRFTQSADGSSWSSPVPANAPSPGVVCECCWAHVVPGVDTVQVLYRNNDSNLRDIRAVRSLDGGASFTDELDLDPTDWIISGCPVAGPHAIRLGDSVFAVFSSAATAPGQVYLHSYEPDSWTPGYFRPIDPTSDRNQRIPRIASDGSGLAVVWEETGGVPKKGRLLLSWNGSAGLQGRGMALGDSSTALSVPDVAAGIGGYHLVFEQGDRVWYQWVQAASTAAPSPFGFDVEAVRLYPQPSLNGQQQLLWPAAPSLWTLEWVGLDGRRGAPQQLSGPGPHRVQAPANGFWRLRTSEGSSQTLPALRH